MKLSSFSNVFELLYNDVCTVYSRTETENSDGTTTVGVSNTATYTDIPCRVSTKQRDNAETSREENNPIYQEIIIFCNPIYDIKKGDKIVATKKNDDGTTLIQYTGTANLPFAYVTHKEIVLVDVGDA